jgi:DNA polymerase IV
VIAHIDLDSFFVAVERARDPQLAGRAVIIGGKPGSRGLVAAVSREARRAGVRAGMSLEYAAIRCPDGIFLDGAFDAYRSASSDVDAILRRESSEVEWISIDEALVALSHDPVDAVYRIHQQISSMGLDAACGLGRSKVVARVASKLAHPRGVIHVLDGYEARFLASLKVEMLPEIDAAVARKLRARGIRRLGNLSRCSPAQAVQLVGRVGTTLVRHASGIDSTPLRRTPLPRGPIEDRALPQPTADIEVLRAALDDRVARLGHELRANGTYARSITLRLRYADGRSDSRTARLREASALTEVLQAAAADLLQQMARPDRLVRAAGISCSGLLDGVGDVGLFHLK